MSWTKTHDLAVVTGSYMHNGKEKKRYENVGHVMQGDDGGKMICLKRTFNPAGLPPDGRDTVVLSMFEPRPRDDAPPPAVVTRSAPPPPMDPSDDIPF